MKIKEFFKPTKGKVIIFVMLIVFSVFLGFFRTSNCFIDENGEEICRLCGMEGIFNPVLRPVSFLIANIMRGLISNGDIRICSAELFLYYFFILDLVYLYFISSIIILIYLKRKK